MRLIPTIICLFAIVILPAAGMAAPAQDNSSQLLRQAEATANKMVEQFHHDLDFKAVFADNFATDPKLTQRAFSLDEEEKWKQFDLPARKRAYVALMTFLHLWAEYMLIQTQQDVPPEIDRAPKPGLLDSKMPKTLAELDQDIRDVDQLSNAYRKFFPKGAFESAQYRNSIAKGVESARVNHHNVPRVEMGNSKFGIPENVPVYVVRPEAFDYYFIRENGAMKLFYVDIFPNMRLF